MRFRLPWQLRNSGILGMNARNLDYISRYNSRDRYPLVDDKLKTKLLAESFGVTTPPLLFVISQQHQVRSIAERLAGMSDFVIKPAKGSGGKGILVITGRRDDEFIKASGVAITLDEVKRHLSNTLAGLYSLGGQPDVAIVETLIDFDERFVGLSHEGVPDIRVVVFQGYPIMSMLRLSTHASDGKANLHQGAVGVGLDIATGQALNAVQYTRRIHKHPDTGRSLKEVTIPNWRDMLLLASRSHEMTGLGYLGADLVLDRKKGAQLLELNARPGLSIQVANGIGLVPRLRHIEMLIKNSRTILPGYYKPLDDHPPHNSPEERVDYAMRVFAPGGPGDKVAPDFSATSVSPATPTAMV